MTYFYNFHQYEDYQYKLIEINLPMGCVQGQSKKITKKNNNLKYEESEPSINQNFGRDTFLEPKLQVSQRACGYEFAQGQINIQSSKSNTQATNQSRTHSIIQQLQSLINKCKYYYTQHDIDSANDYLLLLQQRMSNYETEIKSSQKAIQLLQSNKSILESVKQQYKDVVLYENQILRGGWIQKSNRKGVKVSTRKDGQTVGVLVESIVDQPFQILISFCIEMDLYKQFMPYMNISRQQKVVDRNCRIGYTQNNLPIVSIREAYFQGIGYNRLNKNNTLFLFTRSIHNRPDLQQKLGYNCVLNEQFVQLQYKYFVLWYEPLAKGKGKITLAMNVDTKLHFIPMWIQDKISQDFGQQFFDNILRLSKQFKNSEWEKNTSINPELFLFFKGAIDRRLHQMQQKQRNYKATNSSSHPTTLTNAQLN